MPSIGGLSVLVFSPDGIHLQPASRQVALLEPSFAVDGNGVILGAYSTRPQGVRTVVEVAGGYSAASSAASAYLKLVGTKVTVIDQFGNVIANVVVLAMTFAISAKAGYTGTWRLEARWHLLIPTTIP